MLIRNEVYIDSAEEKITFDPSDEICMLKAPDFHTVRFGETSKFNVTPKTRGDCTGRIAGFALYFSGYDIPEDASADWKKPPTATWKVENVREHGLCLDVNPKNALDVKVVASSSGCH